MKHLKFLALVLLVSTQSHANLAVHEWGTFTSLVGSDGAAQSGMYYEDEALPDFVHNFGDRNWPVGTPRHLFSGARFSDQRCPGIPKVPCEFLTGQLITQKMETPVVYFYSDQPRKVVFNVGFPEGIISQSYPASQVLLPQAIPGVELKNGFASYELSILKNSSLLPPAVEVSNIYSHARNVASDLIQVGSEVEKFIFYRGLGEFKSKLLTTSLGGSLKLKNLGSDQIPAAFLIFTDGSRHGAIRSLGALDSQSDLSVSAENIQLLKSTLNPQQAFLTEARAELLASLKNSGLHHDEAQAMVDTWENGYFKTPGLRVLYILGNHEVESILPIRITPEPTEIARVFVGRIEVLLDLDEKQLLSDVMNQGKSYDVLRLGHMAHPLLLRVREVAKKENLLTDELASVIDSLIARIP